MLNVYLPLAIIALATASVWSFVAFKTKGPWYRAVGPAGAWIGALIISAIWQADALGDFWVYFKLLIVVWQLALAVTLAGAAIGFVKYKNGPRKAILICAAVTVITNLAMAAGVLWYATTSAGGV